MYLMGKVKDPRNIGMFQCMIDSVGVTDRRPAEVVWLLLDTCSSRLQVLMICRTYVNKAEEEVMTSITTKAEHNGR